MEKQTGCGRTIADLADCASLAKTNLSREGYLTDGQLWLRLGCEIESACTDWQQFVPAGTCLAVLRLDFLEVLRAYPGFTAALQKQHILSPTELVRLHSFSHGKRSLEWLGGRLAAKYVLQQFSLSCVPEAWPAAFVINNDRHGRPYVTAPCFSREPYISISHSGQFAAAAVALSPCGLDMQGIVTKLERLQTRFASPAELTLGSSYDKLSWLAMLWAAKEAVKKYRYFDQPTFMERIQVVAHAGCATEPQGAVLSCCLQDEADAVAVRVAVRKKYAMAISAGENHA